MADNIIWVCYSGMKYSLTLRVGMEGGDTTQGWDSLIVQTWVIGSVLGRGVDYRKHIRRLKVGLTKMPRLSTITMQCRIIIAKMKGM